MWINFALSIKRLRDRDRTGRWIGALYVVIVVAVLLGAWVFTLPEGQRQPWGAAAVAVAIAAIGFMLWLFIEIGFLRGTQGPNRYGPDPLGDISETPREAKL